MATTNTDCDTGDGRRSSIEKKPIIVPDTDIDLDTKDSKEAQGPSAFERLPDEIIQQYALFCLSVYPSTHLVSNCWFP